MNSRRNSKLTATTTAIAYGLLGGLIGYLILHPAFQLTQNPSSLSSFGTFWINVFSPSLLFEAYYFMLIGTLAGITLGYLSYQNFKIKQMAIFDELTYLHNRRYYNHRFPEEVKRAIRYKKPLSILIIDIDSFKHYNDRNGHHAGDILLQDFAKLMYSSFRKTDILCRYGGEEFVAIVPEADKAGAKNVAEIFRKNVQNHPFRYRTAQPKGKITVSIGISELPTHGTSPAELFVKADKALYQAKQTGRNKTVVAN